MAQNQQPVVVGAAAAVAAQAVVVIQSLAGGVLNALSASSCRTSGNVGGCVVNQPKYLQANGGGLGAKTR